MVGDFCKQGNEKNIIRLIEDKNFNSPTEEEKVIIDFVIEKNGKVIGIEVKSGAAHPTASFAAFQKQVMPEKVLLVGNAGLPWQEFLKMNPVQLF